ncbi:MAG: (E)-4-hydroxy-3-methylbut-2-enyl-diphosphate synthase [Ignavibacteria bacterium]|nr:(E)-4-hydroxy-3-methylbut-2-enyl-diphosphate synthase [Ignavibacteria bacterium]
MNYNNFKYCPSLTDYKRFITREVNVGGVPLGGNNPIRIQSMTTTDTMDTIATVEQTIRMVESGCEYVRITAPSIKEAENLKNIKDELRKRGYNVPLIADIHFTPNAAETAARLIEKVRVNPGNYVDKKKFQQIEYTDKEYNEEIERIRERFSPLVKICKEYGTALRIGTNHGSLSDRIMSRYGDTPEGMVESALEFARICLNLNYHNLVFSIKSSNTRVMVQAYRLLINRMTAENMNYPIHLGVTEAGGGDDGRIKSALGIGALLEDGIGDTIRVSLTEPPEFEAPVAIKLAQRYKNRSEHQKIQQIETAVKNPFVYEKPVSHEIANIGGNTVYKVFADFSQNGIIDKNEIEQIGYKYSEDSNKWNLTDQAADFIYLGKHAIPFDPPASLKIIYDNDTWKKSDTNLKSFPMFNFSEFKNAQIKSPFLNFVRISIKDLLRDDFKKSVTDDTIVFILETDNLHGMAEQRQVFLNFLKNDIKIPVIIKRTYNNLSPEDFQLFSSTDFGTLLTDGFGDGVWAETNLQNHGLVNRTLFGILQAARVRISKTEYIACPSCGRTLFDLVEVTAKIRKVTEHLKGIKIGIMGCIVNGPGEMADADYGYVGSGIDKITLYRGKEVVKRNVQSVMAVDELINLIKEDNLWVDPV